MSSSWRNKKHPSIVHQLIDVAKESATVTMAVAVELEAAAGTVAQELADVLRVAVAE
jgi:hypothetical protein